MNRFLKTLGPLALSAALLHSGVAWSFLKCSHDSDSVFDSGDLEDPSDRSHRADAPELGCFDGDYRVGPFVETSSTARVTGFDEVRLEIASEACTSVETNSFWLKGSLSLFGPFHSGGFAFAIPPGAASPAGML